MNSTTSNFQTSYSVVHFLAPQSTQTLRDSLPLFVQMKLQNYAMQRHITALIHTTEVPLAICVLCAQLLHCDCKSCALQFRRWSGWSSSHDIHADSVSPTMILCRCHVATLSPQFIARLFDQCGKLGLHQQQFILTMLCTSRYVWTSSLFLESMLTLFLSFSQCTIFAKKGKNRIINQFETVLRQWWDDIVL